VRTKRSRLRTFPLRFVPHLPAAEFEVRARSAEEAARKAERQIRRGKGPVVEAIRARLMDELIAYIGKKPSLAPCPCKRKVKWHSQDIPQSCQGHEDPQFAGGGRTP